MDGKLSIPANLLGFYFTTSQLPQNGRHSTAPTRILRGCFCSVATSSINAAISRCLRAERLLQALRSVVTTSGSVGGPAAAPAG